MKKALKILIYFTVIFFTIGGILSYFDDNKADTKASDTEKVESIEDKIVNTLSRSEKRDFFDLITTAQDRALKEAKVIVPNDNNFNERYDVQLELQAKYELEVYKKQSWWKEINEDVKTANQIRNEISGIGVKSGWLN